MTNQFSVEIFSVLLKCTRQRERQRDRERQRQRENNYNAICMVSGLNILLLLKSNLKDLPNGSDNVY